MRKSCCVSTLLTFCFVAFGRADVSVLVGSAGCDADDSGCREGTDAAEQQVLEVLVDGDGKITTGSRNFSSGGRPVWLVSDPASGCLIATLADKDMLYTSGHGHSSLTSSGGKAPVFAAVANSGTPTLLVANYHGPDDISSSEGSGVAAFAINKADCTLKLVDVKPHNGSSVDPKRQRSSHVHSVVPGRHGLAYACDLGMDTITVYVVGVDGTLTEVSSTAVRPGSGPRHAVEHPTLPMVFVVNEMGQSVSSLRFVAGGGLEVAQEVILAKGGAASRGSKAAELVISADGSQLYATNRGLENTVTAYAVKESGELQHLKTVEAPAYPRGMTLLPDGKLLVAGQSESSLWTYSSSLEHLGTLELAQRLPHPAALAVVQENSAPSVEDLVLAL
mmetsp:Transcript_12485/g.29411  ORF Transcript_12485/g.29411 Transcript_12485/m.29411 type:complete len:391 (+) Transcript_12485:86-1258(+)